jgi:hypothetical protein
MSAQVKLYHFFVAGTRFETDKASLTANEVKALAGVDPSHQLFFRDDVNTPDRLIRDTQHVELIARTAEDGTGDRSVAGDDALNLDEIHEYHGHFYAVPNSSYRRLKSNP